MFTVLDLLYCLRNCSCTVKFKGLNSSDMLGYAFLSNGDCELTGCLDEFDFYNLEVDSFVIKQGIVEPCIIVRVDL